MLLDCVQAEAGATAGAASAIAAAAIKVRVVMDAIFFIAVS
jgi:hypothetical protein